MEITAEGDVVAMRVEEYNAIVNEGDRLAARVEELEAKVRSQRDAFGESLKVLEADTIERAAVLCEKECKDEDGCWPCWFADMIRDLKEKP